MENRVSIESHIQVMQEDFHYYATYCAAFLAGYSHEESLTIAYSAQFVDLCSLSFLNSVDGPEAAATTQLKLVLLAYFVQWKRGKTAPNPGGLTPSRAFSI